MKYRIVKDECSDTTGTWYRFYPEYKKWYNIFWQRWYDPFYGWADGFNNYEDVENFIKEQKRRNSYKQKNIKIYKQ